MHSSRKKQQSRAAARTAPRPNPDWPTHSKLGNPYPAGLEPVVIDESMEIELDVEADWWKDNTYAPGEPQPYLYELPDPQWPRLNLYPGERRRNDTDEQYAIYRRCFERDRNRHAVWLSLCQHLCTLLDNHRTCPVGACRRNGACTGIRDQTRYWLPLLVYPPCVPLDREIMETYREELKKAVDIFLSQPGN